MLLNWAVLWAYDLALLKLSFQNKALNTYEFMEAVAGLINGEGLIYTYLGDPQAGLIMMT